MTFFEPTYKPFGPNALLIEWPSKIDEKILLEILSLQELIEDRLSSMIVETQNTYHSLTIFFDGAELSWQRLTSEIKELRALTVDNTRDKEKIWKLPVCYDSTFGIDLEGIAKTKHLSVQEIIQLHTERLLRVYFIGFLPGFLYLGGLPDQLSMPRKETPRPDIMKGAVAIGGSQTGIYPRHSPGGWNIIGNCPIPLFDIKQSQPCFIKAGDQLKFFSISIAEYNAMSEGIQNGSFDINSLHV